MMFNTRAEVNMFSGRNGRKQINVDPIIAFHWQHLALIDLRQCKKPNVFNNDRCPPLVYKRARTAGDIIRLGYSIMKTFSLLLLAFFVSVSMADILSGLTGALTGVEHAALGSLTGALSGIAGHAGASGGASAPGASGGASGQADAGPGGLAGAVGAALSGGSGLTGVLSGLAGAASGVAGSLPIGGLIGIIIAVLQAVLALLVALIDGLPGLEAIAGASGNFSVGI
uniref:Col_cuticle_N domain-containing protein n=1 Tax=Steinernema glaseri TaxID=37863 RepID=A0A1I7ZC66_9BILA